MMNRRLLAGLVSVIFLGGLFCGAAAADRAFLTGLRLPSAEDRAEFEARAVKRSAPTRLRSELPGSVKNVDYLPAVNRQTLPNCGAYAPTYYLKTYLESRKRGWGRVDPVTHPERATSPANAYVFGQSDAAGGSIIGSISVMRQVGALPLSRLPDSYNYDRTQYPPTRFFVEAMAYRAEEAVLLNAATDDGFLALKEWLADGEIAVFGLSISETMFDYGREPTLPEVDNDVIYGRGGPAHTGHAFTLIGYDDTKTYNDGTGEKQGAFYAVNSWGGAWGVADPDVGTGGFLWISYAHFRASVFDVYSMTLADDTDPAWVGVFEYEHPYSPQVQLSFWGGEEEDADWARPWVQMNPSEDASYALTHPLAVDFTGESDVPSEAFWWRIFNVGSIPGLSHPATTGTAHSFRIYDYEDLLEALPTTLFTATPDGYQWHLTPLSRIDAPHLAAEGLPSPSRFLPNFVDLSVGMMDGGEEILETPLVYGSVIFADLNGNGLQDLLVVGAETQLYENLGGDFRRIEGHGIPNVSSGAASAGDFDRDGLPDVAVCGSIDSLKATRVYRNEGGFRFTDVEADLPGVNGSMMGLRASIAWGDYDNDGREDLAFWGFGASSSKQIHVYRNAGDGAFESAAFQLPERHGAQVAWHDINADGWLDLCAGSHVFLNEGNGMLAVAPMGYSDYHDYGVGTGLWADFTGNGLPDLARNQTYLVHSGSSFSVWQRMRFYRNLGGGLLEDSGILIPKVGNARLTAADYNNDGRMDLIATHSTGNFGGLSASTARATSFFRQMRDGTFKSAGFDTIGTLEGDIALADIDGDGDLDALTSGYIQTDGASWQSRARLYRSRFSQSPLGGQGNTSPTPPSELEAVHDSETGEIVFQWQHGTDAETTRTGLAYNVRIGRWPGGGTVVSPAASAPFVPTVRMFRLTPDRPGLILRNAQPGYYYWSVRTVDGARGVSEWAPEQLLSTLEGFDGRDINGDGVFDASDLVLLARLLDELRDVLPSHYDFNEDGIVDQADLRTLARFLAGSEEAFGGSYPIGPEGGVISQDGLDIVVPAGAFPASPAVALTIEWSDTGATFEAADTSIAYRVSGMPIATGAGVELVLTPRGESGDSLLVFVGEEVLARGASEVEMRYRVMTPETLPDGRLRLSVPTLPADPTLRGVRGEANTYTLNLGVLGGYAQYAGPRFSIGFPQSYVGDQVENLMSGFESAHTLLRDTHGFSYAGRTRWPVEVCIRDLGPDEDGAMLSSTWGDNYGTIEINSRVLGDSDKARATASHEFFHLVQGLYDPRGRVAKAYRMSQHYWLDEAMSSWAESLTTPADYVPGTYRDNPTAPFLGVVNGITGSVGSVAEYGYGMAPLAKYLVQRHGVSAPLNAYTAIYSGADSVAALRAAVPDTMLFIWYDQFFSDLIEEKMYSASPSELMVIVDKSRRLVLEPSSPSTWRRFAITTTDLSGALHLVGIDSAYPEIPTDAFFAVRYEGDASLAMQMFRSSLRDPPERLDAVYGYTEVRFATIANARAFQENQWRLLALVSNTNDDAPYDREREGALSVGLARSGPFVLQSNTVSALSHGRSFPVFDVGGNIEADALSDLKENASTHFHIAQAAAWGGESVDMTLSSQATIDSLSETWTEGATVKTLSTTGIQTYKINKGDGDGNVLESSTDDGGVFPVTLDDVDHERGITTYDIRAVYPVTYQEEGSSPQTFTAEWPLVFFAFTQP